MTARLNRDTLRTLAKNRLEEARVLLENSLWTGAYYMTGLAIECALKAILAQTIQQYDLPDKNFINRLYTHKLNELAQLDAALWHQLQTDMKGNVNVQGNWETVILWESESRYEIINEADARSLYKAATEPGTGIMEWIWQRLK